MKKIIAAGAAALCATVVLADIESSNIVGYQTKAVRKDLSQQVCTFDQIGVTGGALDIQKLIPVDENGDPIGDGAINIQFYGPLGALTAQYAYYCEDEYDDGFPAGWYDENQDELVSEITFDAGEGFDVQAGSICNFLYAGEVNMAETDVPFRKDLSAQGNFRPVAVDIQDIIPVNDDDEYIGDGDITIQFYGALGALDAQYAYYGADEYDDGFVAGWYDENEDELVIHTFQPGEGFKIQAGQAGYLRFPEL